MSADCSSGACEVKGSGSCESETRCACPCGTDCGGDPISCAVGLWSGSFFQAMRAAQVELLKSKIQKAWGQKMDKAADAVLEAMGVQWESMLAQAGARAALRERLAGLWKEGK